MPSSISRSPRSASSSNSTTGVPLSERQQLALVKQMTGDAQTESEGRQRNKERNERGETALHIAAIKGDLEQVKTLLDQGADPNVADFAGWTPLHEACNHGWLEVAKRLLERGANINARGLNDDTPLHDAAVNGHTLLVCLLVKHGANLNLKNKKGKTPYDVSAVHLKEHLRTSTDSNPSTSGSFGRDGTQPGEMRKQPPQAKVDKSGSQRVTLRLHQLKNRGSEEKKDRGGGKNTASDAEPYDSSSTNMEGASKSSAPPSDDVQLKESGGGSGGNNGGAGSASGNSGPGASAASGSGGASEEGDGGEMAREPSSADSVPVASGDATEQSPPEAGVKRHASPDEDEESKRKRRKEDIPTTRGKSGSTSGGSPKSAVGAESEGEEGVKSVESPGPKVPPLKIVIPSQTESEQGTRNGKSTTRHHQALPYVVARSEPSGDTMTTTSSSTSAGSSGSIGVTNASGNNANANNSTNSNSNNISSSSNLTNISSLSSSSSSSSNNINNNNNVTTNSSNSNTSISTSSCISNISSTTITSSSNINTTTVASSSTSSSSSSNNTNVNSNINANNNINNIGSNLNIGSSINSNVGISSSSSTTATTTITTTTTATTTSSSGNGNQQVVQPPASSSPPTLSDRQPTSDGDGNGTSLSADEQRSHQRVLRSSHRSGGGSSGAPSGSSSPVAPDNPSPQNISPPPSEPSSVPMEQQPPPEEKPVVDQPDPPPVTVELHPRKRKMKPRDSNPTSESSDSAPSSSQIHTQDQPITNCYQLFLNIRKQIDRRRKGLFPVQPKPPQGFKDYLMNRCTYVLAGNASSRMTIPQISPPSSLQPGMKDLFTEQEKERYRLRMQHVIEKEKLVLSVEQEILRVHGRAARALANQALPFSACTILRDEEVYSAITPEQEEKDRNARSRYNGRLFLSWLQDVDDKWEKIKEAMLLRHHNEAESLHAVQKMDWEWKLKELGLCEFKARPTIDDSHVPMVHVSDDFDLLPA